MAILPTLEKPRARKQAGLLPFWWLCRGQHKTGRAALLQAAGRLPAVSWGHPDTPFSPTSKGK